MKTGNGLLGFTKANTAGPSAARDDGSPLQPEKSIAKEIGVRYGDKNFTMSVTGFHTDFKDVIVIDNTNADDSQIMEVTWFQKDLNYQQYIVQRIF